MYFPLLFVAVQLLAFVPQRKAALLLKKERGWRVSGSSFAETKSSFSRGSLSNLPWGWYIAGLAAIIASAAAAFAEYPNIPDRIVRHYGFDMQPDAWMDKSVGAVLTVPIMGVFALIVMWAAGAAP